MTIRNPEASVAARLVSDFLKNNNVSMPHTKCLEMVALMLGYKNAQHSASAKPPVAPSVAPTFGVYVHFGEEATRAWDDETNPQRAVKLLDKASLVQFATQPELDAYCQGLSDGSGWADYSLTTMAQAQCQRAFVQQSHPHLARVCIRTTLVPRPVKNAGSAVLSRILRDLGIAGLTPDEQLAKFQSIVSTEFHCDQDDEDWYLRKTSPLLALNGSAADVNFAVEVDNDTVRIVFDTWFELEVASSSSKDMTEELAEYLEDLFVDQSLNFAFLASMTAESWAFPWVAPMAVKAEITQSMPL